VRCILEYSPAFEGVLFFSVTKRVLTCQALSDNVAHLLRQLSVERQVLATQLGCKYVYAYHDDQGSGPNS
jgi:hypothetical protein